MERKYLWGCLGGMYLHISERMDEVTDSVAMYTTDHPRIDALMITRAGEVTTVNVSSNIRDMVEDVLLSGRTDQLIHSQFTNRTGEVEDVEFIIRDRKLHVVLNGVTLISFDLMYTTISGRNRLVGNRGDYAAITMSCVEATAAAMTAGCGGRIQSRVFRIFPEFVDEIGISYLDIWNLDEDTKWSYYPKANFNDMYGQELKEAIEDTVHDPRLLVVAIGPSSACPLIELTGVNYTELYRTAMSNIIHLERAFRVGIFKP